MVYITVEAVTNIRNALKEKFPECKFSVRKEGDKMVSVAILESPYFDEGENFIITKPTGDKTTRKFLRKMEKVIKTAGEWYDNSDIKSGTFDVAFFYQILVGREESPHEKVEVECE